MTTRPYGQTPPAAAPAKHLSDYLRVLYKRRWLAGAALLAVFVYGAVNAIKQTPLYQAKTQIMIEKEVRRATSINDVLDEQSNYYDDDFYPTQLRILQSRKLAARVVEKLSLQPAPGQAAGPAWPAVGRRLIFSTTRAASLRLCRMRSCVG